VFQGQICSSFDNVHSLEFILAVLDFPLQKENKVAFLRMLQQISESDINLKCSVLIF